MLLVELLVSLVKAVVWIGGWSQLVGMPLAWLRIRRTETWREPPEGERRLDLLAEFMLGPTVAAIAWAWLTIALLAVLDVELSPLGYFVAVWGPPTVFVPVAVLRLDRRRLPEIAERRRSQRLRAAASR